MQNNIANRLKACSQKELPSFVIVVSFHDANVKQENCKINDMELAVIYFLDSDKKQMRYDSCKTDSDGAFMIDEINIDVVREQLLGIMPDYVKWRDTYGWLVPLKESYIDNPEAAQNCYMHNLMFWESMLEEDLIGPLAEREKQMQEAIKELLTEQEEIDCIVKSSELGKKRIPDNMVELIRLLVEQVEKSSMPLKLQDGSELDNEFFAKCIAYLFSEKEREKQAQIHVLLKRFYDMQKEMLVRQEQYLSYIKNNITTTMEKETDKNDLYRRILELLNSVGEK